MKKQLLALAVLAAFAASAHAGGNSNNSNNTTNNYDNRNYGGNTTNQGGHGGTGVGLGIGIGQGGNASATGGNANAAGGSVIGSGNSSNTVRNDNRNTNSNLNAQGQQQGQAQGQGQGQSQSTANANNSSLSVGGDTINFEAQKRDPVSSAWAASIAPTAPCMGSTSGGAQGVGFGFSIAGTWTDENCVLLEQVRATNNLGEKEVALEMMMDIPAYAAAKKRIADRKAGKVSFHANDDKRPTAAGGPDLTDPYIAMRLAK